jgi:acetolactate synthase-1/3 small subunit
VAGLFSARGFNIESLTVAATNDLTLSRMTIVSVGNDNIIEQIVKQLYKLIDVVKVTDLTATEHIERELLLVKIDVNQNTQADIDKKIDEFSAKIVDVSEDTYIIELAGQSKKINDFLDSLGAFKILEVSRTGVTGVCQRRES